MAVNPAFFGILDWLLSSIEIAGGHNHYVPYPELWVRLPISSNIEQPAMIIETEFQKLLKILMKVIVAKASGTA